MSKRFSDECIVRIWPTATDVFLLLFRQRVGHASLTLRGSSKGKDWLSYISWWPSNPRSSYTDDQWAEASFGEASYQKALTKPKSKKEKLYANIWNAYRNRVKDVQTPTKFALRKGQKIGLDPKSKRIILGQSATTKFYLPGLGRASEIRGKKDEGIDKDIRPGIKALTICEKRYWGLSLKNMANYWAAHNKEKFNLLKPSRNCAGMVRRILLAGGADAYAPPPSENSLINPNDVEKWAAKLQQALDNLDLMTHMFEKNQLPAYLKPKMKPKWWDTSDMLAGLAATIGDKEPLMVYSQFRKFFKKDSQIIKKAMTEYHGIKGWGINAVNIKLKALIKIMNYVTSQINAYQGPKNDAFYWLLLLGKQVIHVLSGVKIKGDEVNDQFFKEAKKAYQKDVKQAYWWFKESW